MKKHTQNNFLAYLLVLGSFFILIFFTKNIYGQIQEQSDELAGQSRELVSQRDELTRLKQLQQDLSAEDSQADIDIKWFSWEFSDKNLIDHVYSYAQEVNLWSERIIIRDMAISGWELSDVWFSKANIDLDIITSSEETLFSFLNYLTDEDSTFRFYISNFDYDLWGTNGNITVSIPLTLYYK